MSKIKILHIVRNHYFFKTTLLQFGQDSLLKNDFILYTKNTNIIQSFNEEAAVKIFKQKKQLISFINSMNYDIIYFHTVMPYLYNVISNINHGPKVVWWAWGADLYYKYGFLKPMIKVELYKPVTKRYIFNKGLTLSHWIRFCLKDIISLYYLAFKNKAFQRITHIQTVTQLEYDILKNNPICKHFNRFYAPAKNFSLKFKYHPAGNMIIGNSASATNNHADIIIALSKLNNIRKREVFIPLSYGDKKYTKYIKEIISKTEKKSEYFNYKVIENFIPYNAYESIFASCSHAIFGVVRQQAMGNINLCFLYGIKVFFYKNSILYKNFLKLGYIIFAIDDQLNKKELDSPLSYEQAAHNFNLYINGLKKERSIYESLVRNLSVI